MCGALAPQTADSVAQTWMRQRIAAGKRLRTRRRKQSLSHLKSVNPKGTSPVTHFLQHLPACSHHLPRGHPRGRGEALGTQACTWGPSCLLSHVSFRDPRLHHHTLTVRKPGPLFSNVSAASLSLLVTKLLSHTGHWSWLDQRAVFVHFVSTQAKVLDPTRSLRSLPRCASPCRAATAEAGGAGQHGTFLGQCHGGGQPPAWPQLMGSLKP